jgi:hypothetical protein
MKSWQKRDSTTINEGKGLELCKKYLLYSWTIIRVSEDSILF